MNLFSQSKQSVAEFFSLLIFNWISSFKIENNVWNFEGSLLIFLLNF